MMLPPFLMVFLIGFAHSQECALGNLTCEVIGLCPAVRPVVICDGTRINCRNGLDESNQTCSDVWWGEQACPTPGWMRCQGGRPGQCYDQSKRCDGQYDCIDRTDEDECQDYHRNKYVNATQDEPDTDPNPEEGIDDKWLGFLVVVVGVPLTWLIKCFLVKCFVSFNGTKITYPDEMQNLNQSSDEEMVQVLKFIDAMVKHVEGTEDYLEHKDHLMSLFEPIHQTAAWSDNVKIIFDMGNLLFEADYELIDEFHTVMYDLEKTYYKVTKTNIIIRPSLELTPVIFIRGMSWP